ncbi:PDR/VanB family oxidoreductase [Rhodococcus sp. NPDC056960]|uniref:PDR/VanB family oxidoreductase n=1 Tax=Rhodococcus sp. NPDC056960 TaxID=3345982 RepID=UPI003624FF78
MAAVDEAADGVRSLVLTSPDGEFPSWQPGSHIDLVLADGLERQYSLCGDPAERDTWRIAVLREPRSRGGSEFVHEKLSVGDRVRVRGPRNHFPMPDADDYLFVAGGIGITPILAMVEEADRRGKNWTLLYGGRTRASMAFLDRLHKYGDRVVVSPQDTHGLLDLAGFLATATPDTAVAACGPSPLLDALGVVCASMPAVRLHVERFTAPVRDFGPATAFDVELARSGKTIRVGEDQSILTAVRAAGVTAYSSCAEGICGTCETTVLGGVPEHRDAVLADEERAESNSMMICVSRCTSSTLVLDL